VPYQFDVSFSDNEELMEVSQGNDYSFVNRKGELKFPYQEDVIFLTKYYQYGFVVCLKFNDYGSEIRGIIDTNGNYLAPIIYDKLSVFNPEYNLASAYKDGKWGMINYRTNKVVLDFKYRSISNYWSEGLVRFQDESKKYGFANEKGEIQIPCIYTACDEHFKNGKIKATTKVNPKEEDFYEVDRDGNSFLPSAIPFNIIENVPVYPGCETSESNESRKQCMKKKISKHVVRNFNSDLGNDLGLTGKQRIFVNFVIDETGKVTNIKARAKHPRLEKEGIKVVAKLPRFIPATQDGKNVAVKYTLPITFVIED